MTDRVKKKINGHDYEVGHFPAFYNYNLFIKFSSIVSVSLPQALSALSNNSDSILDSKINFLGLGEAVRELVTSLYINDKDGEFMLEIMSQTTRDGRAINKVTFNEFYTGNMPEMLEALILSVNTHFSGLLPKKLFGLAEISV